MEKQINYYECTMEYDKSLPNTNKERDMDTGQDMREINQDIICGENTIRLILQFPEKEQDIILVQKEIKEILITELKKQINSSRNEEQDFYRNERSDCR